MRILLDTHALLWWFLDDPALSRDARAEIGKAEAVLVSAISGLEIATKFRIGRLPEAERLVMNFESMAAEVGFLALSVTTDHALLAGRLAFSHKDPFDRVLIAQSMLERVPLVSNERLFDTLGVKRLW